MCGKKCLGFGVFFCILAEKQQNHISRQKGGYVEKTGSEALLDGPVLRCFAPYSKSSFAHKQADVEVSRRFHCLIHSAGDHSLQENNQTRLQTRKITQNVFSLHYFIYPFSLVLRVMSQSSPKHLVTLGEYTETPPD